MTTRQPEQSEQPEQPEQVGALRAIAVFKLFKGIVLFAAGLGVLGLLRDDWNDAVVDVLHRLALEHGRRLASAFADRAAAMLDAATPRRLTEVAVGCFIYGGIFLVEAIGLWTKRRWAEYLTAVMTASLLPFEAVALAHRVTVERGLALLVNLAIVAYLAYYLWKRRGGGAARTDAEPVDARRSVRLTRS